MSITLHRNIFEEEEIFNRKKNYYKNTLAFSLEKYNQKPQQLLRRKEKKSEMFSFLEIFQGNEFFPDQLFQSLLFSKEVYLI